MSLHTLLQVFLTTHNVTIYSLMHFPQKFCIPVCIRNLFCHLEVIFLAIIVACSFIGSLTDHSSRHRPA